MGSTGRSDHNFPWMTFATAGLLGLGWYRDARRRNRDTNTIRRVFVDVLLNALSSGDNFTERHSRRVAALTDALGSACGFHGERKARLRLASLLHDMGKIDDRFFHILHSCEPLDPSQRKRIEQHPFESAHILEPLERLYPGITRIVESHHERWDGLGYPRGLSGEEVPLESRIISVADVFDALTQPRSYKNPRSADDVLAEIRRGSGEGFDPGVIQLLDRSDVQEVWRTIAKDGNTLERSREDGETTEDAIAVGTAAQT
jgi:HD-GYP domain-containing protein (c-di-GMP phosphodiesterase class II)